MPWPFNQSTSMDHASRGGGGLNVNPGGGVTQAKPLPYSPPKGPSNIGDPKSPGLHGTNHGVCGTQGKR